MRPRNVSLRSLRLAAVLALVSPTVVLAIASTAATQYVTLPLAFEANRGQSAGPAQFLARGPGYGLFLAPGEAVLSLRSGSGAQVVRMRTVNGDQRVAPEGLDPLPHASNHFFGDDPSRWQRDVPNFARVKYAGVYPGIDLIYHGSQRQLEYDFVVAPGADPRRIALAFTGVERMAIDKAGNLVLKIPGGELVQRKPFVYQEVEGARTAVDGRYVLLAGHRVGFALGRYDRRQALVIDPVLGYSTYLGGGGNDVAQAIAVDAAGNAYIAGSTTSLNFPGTTGNAIGASLTGSTDAFVAKLNPAGNALVYSAYLGGSGSDSAFGIAVDSAGNAYVTGETDSSPVQPGGISFPTVAAFQSTYKGGGDAFVTKINAVGNALLYSTYLGGTGVERGHAIAVDAAGNAYVSGHTNSNNTSSGPTGGFPTLGALQGDNGGSGNYDAFVSKFSTGGALVYSTYLGGNGSEYSVDGGGIAVDGAGNAYVGGSTSSTNFPGASTSTIQPAYGGGFIDGFVVKLNPAGNALVYSSYLGGSTYDAVNGIAVDAAGNAYVAGYTDSPNFPTAAALQPARAGTFGNDAFVAKINAAGSALTYSTYLGGSGSDIAYAIVADAAGNAYVSGTTTSSDFPTASATQPSAAGAGDAFIAKLNAAGSALMFSTYLGGSNGAEHAYGIAIDGGASIFVAGSTTSTNFPTLGAIQATKGVGNDAFVTRIRLSGTARTDLNGDGRSDLLYRNFSTGQLYRMLMNGLSISSGAMAYTEPNLAWKVVGDADFNGDGVTDLLWRNSATGQVFVMPFSPAAVPAGGAVVATEPSAAWKIVHTPDLNGDGKADILWWNSSTGQVYAMLLDGASIIAQGFVYTEPDTAWKIAAAGDFSGSGAANQLLWRNSLSGQLYLMTVSVSGATFSTTGQVIYNEPNTAWKVLAAADFNGDGKSDILYRNDATGQVYVLLMNGPAVAGGGLVHTEPNLAWKVVSQGDYNGDGRSDLLWRNESTGQVHIMLMNGLAIGSQATVYAEPDPAWKLLGPYEYSQ